MNTENKKIGQKIKNARTSMGLTQSQLGRSIGVTGSAIGYLEAGLRKISPDALKKIANSLNKPFKYFYEESEEKYDLFGKIMKLKGQLGDIATTVEKIEKEKFGLKDFYESMIESISKSVFFLDNKGKTIFSNKYSMQFLKNNFHKSEFDGIMKQFDKEIKNSTLFKPMLGAKTFSAKSVYDNTGLYLGIWFYEK